MVIKGPTLAELDCLSRILRKATHKNVADATLKGFLWACWPVWYEHYKKEFLLHLAATESARKVGPDDER